MNRVAGLLLLGVVGAAGVGCATTDADWRERYLEKERDANEFASQLTAEKNARAAAVAQLEEARSQVTSLQRENDALRSGGAVAEAPAPVPVPDSSMNDTVEGLKRSGLDAHVTADGNIAVVLPADINFGSGSKELTAQGKQTVAQLSRELQGQFAGYSVRIEGHTDGDPIRKSNFKDNWELGSERALSVLRCLQQEHGVSPERLIGATRGETVPVADNKSDKGKARNRRVEIVVLVPKNASMAK
jgi:chemotaxis protein MotB